MNRAIISILIVLSSLSVSSAWAKNETIKLNFSEYGEGNPVVFSFNGMWVTSGDDLVPIAPKDETSNKYANFIHRVIEVNRKNKVDLMLSVWSESDRDKIKKKMKNPKARSRNQKLYENIGKSWVFGAIKYGKYTICFVVHSLKGTSPFVKTYPMEKMSDGEFKLTNALSDDFVAVDFSNELANFYFENQWEKMIQDQ